MKLNESINTDEVAKLVNNNNIIGIFQGRSEAGPRALGNRSFILNPCIESNKDKMNLFKGRELFRPLAASVLEQHAEEWFHMLNIKKSPYMTFSFKVRENKKNLIPAVVHCDNSCRIQTVNKEENLYFYELINHFYKLTSIPMVLNTSFNLAGDPLVETVEDALNTFDKSNLNYLYFPELKILLSK
jgi:carbamoyltransferase